MKDACFLSPIHPPKFNHGLNFIKTYNEFFNDDHIYLVFSSIDEENTFLNLASNLRFRSIVCPTLKSPLSPTTEKKFFGIQEIFKNTNFVNVGVVDIDTDFFKHLDYSQLFHEHNSQKTIYGNDYQFTPYPILESPLKFFNEEDQTRIKEMTSNCRAYFWFNDIPIYNRKYFLNFIKYINYNNRDHELVWMDFDFIIYAYYLMLKENFVLKPILVNNELLNGIFLEDQLTIDSVIFNEIYEKIQPMWIVKEIDKHLMTKTFMHLHIDRNIK